MAILRALTPLALDPPEFAVITAVPLIVPALNIASARPLTSVSTSDGTTEPSVVVKATCVPECGGVPLASITCTLMRVLPFSGSAVTVELMVIMEPAGANSGTLSHDSSRRTATAATETNEEMRSERGIMKELNILISMNLAGQARSDERGYAMAALLVAIAIMTIMMTVALPVWKQTAQREKEEELIFRGNQYTHAIGLFQRKYANAFPPTVDVLVEQRFLRKKFKDPITNEDFLPLVAGQAMPGSPTPGGPTQRPSAGGRGAQTGGAPVGAAGRGGTSIGGATPGTTSPGGITSGGLSSPIGSQPGGGVGGVMGVTSKSKDKSIRLYNGRNHYNEWAFVFTAQQQAPGAGAPGSAVPGQPAVPGQTLPGGGRPGAPGTGRPGGPGIGRPGGPEPGTGRPGGPGPGMNPNPFQPQPIFPPQRGRP